MSSIYYLMRNTVDYAGLFPPAGLPMTQVVENFSRYAACKEHSMLSRLIIPAMKLTAFEESATALLPSDPETEAWKISALVPSIEQQNGSLDHSKFDLAFEAIYQFNLRHAHDNHISAVVDAVELKTPNQAVLDCTLMRLVQDERFKGIRAFLEVPHSNDPSDMLESIAKQPGATVFAKIRTGGVKPDLIPPVSDVARFIHACAKHELGFKATAGLHHPIRAKHKLTYEPDSESATMHGFLNVFVAAAIAFEHQVEVSSLEEILGATSTDVFDFQEDKLTWNGLSVPLASISDTRNHGIVSFGSCSFVEPTEELVQLPGISRKSIFPA